MTAQPAAFQKFDHKCNEPEPSRGNPREGCEATARRQIRFVFLIVALLCAIQFSIEYSKQQEIERFLDPGPRVWLREGPGSSEPVGPPTSVPSVPGEGGVERSKSGSDSARPATDWRMRA
jgi:hypothetical protein